MAGSATKLPYCNSVGRAPWLMLTGQAGYSSMRRRRYLSLKACPRAWSGRNLFQAGKMPCFGGLRCRLPCLERQSVRRCVGFAHAPWAERMPMGIARVAGAWLCCSVPDLGVQLLRWHLTTSCGWRH